MILTDFLKFFLLYINCFNVLVNCLEANLTIYQQQSNSSEDECSFTQNGIFRHCNVEEIDQFLRQSMNGNRNVNITIYDITTTILTTNWITADVTIEHLEFNGGQLAEINNRAFNSGAFNTTTKSLKFTSLKSLKYLARQVFYRMNALVSIIFDSVDIENFEDTILADVGYSIKYFEMSNNSYPVDIYSLSGSVGLPTLEILNFSNNNFSTGLNTRSVEAAYKVTELYLSGCYIPSLPNKIFTELTSIQVIDLSNNLLTNLPENLLSARQLTNSVKSIHLYDNPWNCDCDLVHFKELLNEHGSKFSRIDDIKCSTPSDLHDQPITEANFCKPLPPETTTSDTSTREPESTPPDTTTLEPEITTNPDVGETTTENSLTYELECPSIQENKTDKEKISIHKKQYHFQIKKIRDDEVVVIMEDSYPNTVLLWFNEYSTDVKTRELDDHIGCYIGGDAEPMHEIHVTNLVTQLVHTFCIIDSSQPAYVSPFNCRSIVTNLHEIPQYDDDWLTEESLFILIIVITLLAIVSVAFGCCGVYWLLRRNPHFIKSNQRMVFVNDDILVMPKEFAEKHRLSMQTEVDNKKRERSKSIGSELYYGKSSNGDNPYYIDSNFMTYLQPLPPIPEVDSLQSQVQFDEIKNLPDIIMPSVKTTEGDQSHGYDNQHENIYESIDNENVYHYIRY